MTQQRKRITVETKAKAAREALKGQRTLNEFSGIQEAYFKFYNHQRLHQTLEYQTAAAVSRAGL